MSEQRLRITEIFHSLQGETRTVGLPTAFIRLTGCPLRCTYCDTAYAFKGGNWYSLDDIIAKIAEYNVEYVTVTGGEPLAQPDCIPLLKRLCDLGYQVSLETSGALDDKNLYSNIDYLTKHDAVKFVICSRSDYEWARAISEKYTLADRCEVLFSPSYQQQSLKDLAEWILEDKLKARMQVQLHKYIWGDIPGV